MLGVSKWGGRCFGLSSAVLFGLACVPNQGGWDGAALVAAEPQLAAISGHRIADLTPYPAFQDGRLVFVTCRFDRGAKLSVAGQGIGYRPALAERAIGAMDRALPRLTLAPIAEPEANAGREETGSLIRVLSIADPRAKVPLGVADTLTECDVGPGRAPESATNGDSVGAAGVRGRLLGAEIRIRSSWRDANQGLLPVEDEVWVGALLHELGHALGFAGHPATGESVLVLEQSRMRAYGRLALLGRAVPTPNLSALYTLAAGRVLGQARVEAASAARIQSVLALVREREARLGPALGPIASAGDRAARVTWRWPGGTRLGLVFPGWRAEIATGKVVTARPSRETQQALEASRSGAPRAER